MSWIGVRDQHGQCYFKPEGLEQKAKSNPLNTLSLLPRGTLVMEFEYSRETNARRQNLLRYISRDPWHSVFRLVLEADGLITLVCQQGDKKIEFQLPTAMEQAKGTITLWYTWDAPARRGLLAAMGPDGEMFYTELTGPFPLSVLDAKRICTDGQVVRNVKGFTFLAISDEVEPVGPWATIGANAMLRTINGQRLISDLKPGDLLLTEDETIVQIRSVAKQVLPAMGRFKPMMIRSPYYGAKSDLMLAQNHLVELNGPKIEYLFNEERVHTQIGSLDDGREAVRLRGAMTATYYHLLLDEDVTLSLSGVPATASRAELLAQDRGLHRHSILRDTPELLVPSFKSKPVKTLAPYEAMSIGF
ncbi:hypothetical protein HCZ30_12420 [Marivivens donghaensis]|uniref:Hedgehog/Intein (Hint) domain-containing protein n=1 Tax=Marivivens donghaensis TaxID=1699413 RepID=A0ABX0VZN7_9RHOB|nr:Hint domain-containing protein [Marivivens donghaensis]NIY73230.1 hypothetical protein [Marivivens donghaensis]